MEFTINEFLSLRLESDFTEVYVAGKLFQQCKFLLLEIPVKDVTSLDNVKSIDEAAQELGHELEPSDESSRVDKIPPETEFWGHCSNLQAWYENDYNTKLLHSNLAFPLLKKLTEAGDLLALKVFKDEVANRYNSGIESVRKFLESGNYLRFLTKEEFYSLIDTSDEYEALIELESSLAVKRDHVDVRNGHIVKLSVSSRKLDELPEILTQFEYLEELNVAGNLFNAFPNWICGFNNLKILRFGDKLGTLPDAFGDLKSLEVLDGRNNELRRLPDSFGSLATLKKVDLRNNNLEGRPDSIGSLNNLEELDLKSNNIKVLPESVGKLKSLKILDLQSNNIGYLLESIGSLKSLETLDLGNNNIKTIPKSLGKLESLKTLILSNNNLDGKSDLNSIGKLRNLRILDLNNNSIKTLPYSLKNLVSLKELYLDGNPIEELPEYVINLPKLTILFVRNTKIRKSLTLKKKLKEKNISVNF